MSACRSGLRHIPSEGSPACASPRRAQLASQSPDASACQAVLRPCATASLMSFTSRYRESTSMSLRWSVGRVALAAQFQYGVPCQLRVTHVRWMFLLQHPHADQHRWRAISLATCIMDLPEPACPACGDLPCSNSVVAEHLCSARDLRSPC